jgi:hypothetical protein
MKRLAALVVTTAFALPGAASDPARLRLDRPRSPRPPTEADIRPALPVAMPEPLLSDRRLRLILFPVQAVVGPAAERAARRLRPPDDRRAVGRPPACVW